LIGLGIVVLAVAAFAIGTLTGGNSSSNVNALPAVSKEPIKPRKGQTRASAIYAAASPAVVSVRTDAGSGTGFLIQPDGTLVTNAHVVDNAKHVVVRFGQDGNTIDADVLGVDQSSDLAVLSIEKGSIPNGVKPLQFADSRSVQVGDTAIAIGNPFGLDRTATEGIVSGLGREIQAPNGFQIDSVIQTDAPINPGNSGGPLLNDSGEVIGVNSQIATAGSQGNVGIGFAVPSNTVRQVVPKLKLGETIKRAYLGVETSAASPANPDGADVKSVVPNGPADKAGIATDDVITKIDGQAVHDPTDVSSIIAMKNPGDHVKVTIEHNGFTEEIDVTLGTRPNKTP
jgi:putative serine protease PepD